MLGKYELLSKLATGGMAEVYLARERGLAGMERLVVIKRILPHLAQHPEFVEMFLREGRLIARINHPNIVQIYELGADLGQHYYLALEYIPGVTLRELQVLANRAKLKFPEQVALALGIQAASGLAAAHSMKDSAGRPIGLVHRDVTPHNLMCMESGLLKLLDFGIAKATQGQSEATFSGDLKGKFSYMSPEQVLQQPLDARSDIFSLGIVLWESLTGRRLFKRASQLEMLQAISTGDVPSPHLWREELHPLTCEVVMRALSLEAERRFADAREFKSALQHVAQTARLDASSESAGRFINQVASERIRERDEAVQAVTRLDALSAHQRHRLLHDTNSGIFTGASAIRDDEDLPTIVERPDPDHISSSFGARHFDALSEPLEALSEPLEAPSEEELTRALTASPPRLDGDTAPPQPLLGPQQQKEKAPEVVAPRRRRGLLFALIALIALLGGAAIAASLYLESQAAPVYEGEPLTLGWAPVVDPKVLQEEMVPFHAYLSRALHREVRFVMADSYEDLAERLESGRVDYAVMPPLLYVRTSVRAPQIEPLAIKEFDGSMSSDGLLLVPASEELRAGNVRALRGKSFCLTDINSTTGNFLPRAYLRAQGEDPDELMGEIVWSGDHLQLLRDLSEGKCQVGATHSGAFISADKFGVPVSRLRTFAITGHVPQDVVCASGEVPEELREAMRRALLDFEPTREFGQEYLGVTQRITGFAPSSEEFYTPLRLAVAEELAAGR